MGFVAHMAVTGPPIHIGAARGLDHAPDWRSEQHIAILASQRRTTFDEDPAFSIHGRVPMIPDGESAPAAVMPAAAPAAAPRALSWRISIGAEPDAVRDWFELETIVDLPAPAASFAEAEAAAADYRRAARADNTRRAYRAAVARFTDWCAAHAQVPPPAAPETVAAFLAAEAGRGLAVNTLRLRHAALRYLHLLAGYPPPTASLLVSATFAGIRRAHRRPLRKDRPGARSVARRSQVIPDNLPGRRDRALILVGFAAALRPSELARLEVGSLTRHDDGLHSSCHGARTTRRHRARSCGCRWVAQSVPGPSP